MNDIKDLHKNFVKQIKSEKQRLVSELSECDLAICDALHYLELEKCDGVAMVKTAKIIKELRLKRREIKNCLDEAHRIMVHIGNPNLLKFGVKRYAYRTQVMNDIRKTDINNTK